MKYKNHDKYEYCTRTLWVPFRYLVLPLEENPLRCFNLALTPIREIHELDTQKIDIDL